MLRILRLTFFSIFKQRRISHADSEVYFEDLKNDYLGLINKGEVGDCFE